MGQHESATCPEYQSCIDRRVADAEYKATVTTKLENLIALTMEIKGNLEKTSQAYNRLYLKVAGISGTMAVIVALLVKLI